MNNASTTPIASSRRVKQNDGDFEVKSKSVGWNVMKTASESPTQKEPSSPDMLGKLSLALNNMRNLKEQLAEKESELKTAREEKDKYQSEHSKLYSQITAIRTRCTLFESQLAKKSLENEELKKFNSELELECSKLRKLISDDTSRQTQRIKQLELQANTLKTELASRADINDIISKLEGDKEKLTLEVEEIRKSYSKEGEQLMAENKLLRTETSALTAKIEENRTTIVKLQSERVALTQDLERSKQEHGRFLKTDKDAARVIELEERLAELETERTNAKLALKKAMIILDEGEALRNANEEKDMKIKALEMELAALQSRVKLPSIDAFDQYHNHPLSGDEAPRFVKPEPPVEHPVLSAPEELIKQKLDAMADTKAKLRQLLIN